MVGIAALLGATPGLANATPIEPVRVEQKARTGEDEPWLFYEGSFDEWMQAQRARAGGEATPDSRLDDPGSILSMMLAPDSVVAFSSNGAQEWADGLTNPETHAQHKQLLDELRKVVENDAGVSLGAGGSVAIEAAARAMTTPDEVRLIVEGNREQSTIYQHLLSLAQYNSQVALDEQSQAPDSVSADEVDEVDVLEEIAKSQRDIAEALEKSAASDNGSEWGKVLEKLAPSSLAMALLTIIIDKSLKGLVDAGWRYVTAGRDAKKESKPSAHTDQVKIDFTLELVTSHAGTDTQVALRATHPGGVTVTSEVARATISLSRINAHDPEAVGKFVAAATAGVKRGLSQQVGIRDPAAVAIVAEGSTNGLLGRLAGLPSSDRNSR